MARKIRSKAIEGLLAACRTLFDALLVFVVSWNAVFVALATVFDACYSV